jgi:hypothetical protein
VGWVVLDQNRNLLPVFVKILMQFRGWWRVVHFLTRRVNNVCLRSTLLCTVQWLRLTQRATEIQGIPAVSHLFQKVLSSRLLSKCLWFKTQNYNVACCFAWVWNVVSYITRKYRLSNFENGVLKKLFGPRREKVRQDLIKSHNEEQHDLYSSPNIIGVSNPDRWGGQGHVTRLGGREM